MIGSSSSTGTVLLKIAIVAFFFGQSSTAFVTSSSQTKISFQLKESRTNGDVDVPKKKEFNNEIANKLMNGIMVGTTCLTLASCTLFGFPSISMADEYGQEKEAPTVFTGETLQICTKRGPLGACLETTTRTVGNDNDKSDAYFRDPSETLKKKYSAQLEAEETKDNGSDLIKKLKQQTEDNKDKNALIVKQKTLQNNLVSGQIFHSTFFINTYLNNFYTILVLTTFIWIWFERVQVLDHLMVRLSS